MSKTVHYLLFLLVLTVPTGCCTVKGAATGFQQDAKNTTNAIEKADAWEREHMW